MTNLANKIVKLYKRALIESADLCNLINIEIFTLEIRFQQKLVRYEIFLNRKTDKQTEFMLKIISNLTFRI